MLRSMSGQFGSDIGIMMAGAMILIAPVLIFFMITQRYFIDGLVSGLSRDRDRIERNT